MRLHQYLTGGRRLRLHCLRNRRKYRYSQCGTQKDAEGRRTSLHTAAIQLYDTMSSPAQQYSMRTRSVSTTATQKKNNRTSSHAIHLNKVTSTPQYLSHAPHPTKGVSPPPEPISKPLSPPPAPTPPHSHASPPRFPQTQTSFFA